MSNLTPTPPSFAFSYWRPWKEGSNYFDSYLNYAKDVSLAKYQADTVGRYINEASTQQVNAISELGNKIGLGLDVLSNQMENVHEELLFVNKNLDIQIEQQKVTNLLLKNIGELLRVPDSEKERQHSIELGLKFFVNAQKDDDLFADALEELLEAEKLMKQDYFVLHRIGLIYMYSIKHINPQKALDYFTRAAKYASIESDPKAARLANVLAQAGSHVNSKFATNTNTIQSLAADSYEKAAFAAYVLGDFQLAVTYQTKVVKYYGSAENLFMLAKYQARSKQIDLCIQNLSKSIDKTPSMTLAVFKDLDLINEPEVLKIIEEKNDDIVKNILLLIKEWETVQSDSAKKIIIELNELLKATYDKKVKKCNELNNNILKSNIEGELKQLQKDFLELKRAFQNSIFLDLKNEEIRKLTQDIDDCFDKPLEVMKKVYTKVSQQYTNDRLKIGSKYAGGIVFYIDESGKHGLVASENDLVDAIWGMNGKLGTKWDLGTGKTNTKLIVEQASWSSRLFFKSPLPTAARICAELAFNGYNDWYLPSMDELNLIYKNLYVQKIGGLTESSYWSSTNCDNDYAWAKNFRIDENCGNGKKYSNSVRAVRAF